MENDVQQQPLGWNQAAEADKCPSAARGNVPASDKRRLGSRKVPLLALNKI